MQRQAHTAMLAVRREAQMAAAGPSKALKSVTKLANTPKTSRIELALALADLDDEPGAVADFITTMPTKLRTTYALLEVGRWLRHTGLAMERCEAIGWTKLAILARHRADRPLKKANRTELDMAEKRTAAELPAALAAGPTVKTPQKARNVLLRLTPAQYAVFEAAVLACGAAKAGKGKGLVKKEVGLIAALQKLPSTS